MTDIAAAIGLVQLERAEEMRSARQRVADAYREGLMSAGVLDEVELAPDVPAGDVHAWHLFPIRLRDGGPSRREAVIERLRAAGIGTSVHFIPLHLHPYYRRTYGYVPHDLPVATHEYEREISLPIFPGLTSADVARVVEALSSAVRT